ncbi:MAG: VPLPA-CTERM sorting domain-containing protein [Proteobacteria bacterium]|nr:VPLPA-CTERM sorting domain-containing protein [Pseudomonadota bacterium]
MSKRRRTRRKWPDDEKRRIMAQNARVQLDTAILAVNDDFGPRTDIGSSLDAWQTSHGGFIAPGVYLVSEDPTANLTGDITLNGLGDSAAVWNFLFTSTLVTSTTSNVAVQNVGSGDNVGIYWTVATAATLNGPTFAGNVLAAAAITSDGNLTINCGRLLSAGAAVTLNMDSISIDGCGNDSNGYDQGFLGPQPIPLPAALPLFLSGLAGLGFIARRRKQAT